jgi:hypothetical protein
MRRVQDDLSRWTMVGVANDICYEAGEAALSCAFEEGAECGRSVTASA